MTSEELLRRLSHEMMPAPGARERVRTRLLSRIAVPASLRSARALLTPPPETKRLIWERVVRSLSTPRAHDLLTELKAWFTVSEGLKRALWIRVSPELVPVRRGHGMFWGMKWAAAVLLIAFVFQLSPRLFWAPSSVAGSEPMLLPHGSVSILVDETWQPVTEEVTLRAGMRIQTGSDGQASIVLNDDGVIRIDTDSMVDLVDLSDRTEPALEIVPTLSLFTGRLWIQGLVPASLKGLTVYTPVGLVTVHEGSVSIGGGKVMDVAVYDRRAQVSVDGRDLSLVAGKRAQLKEGTVPMALTIPQRLEDSAWVKGNLTLDAVHRQEVADLQKERLAERAGVLPTSTLYPVKRAVEAVDLFLTLGEEARIQKKLQYADARLTEAAALLADGQTGAVALSLQEYRSTLVALATGSGDATLAQFLLKQVIAQNTSDVSAVLPGDQAYIIKRVVLETSSELSDGVVESSDAQGGLLLDALAVLTQTVESGNLKGLPEMWMELQPQIEILKSQTAGALKPEVQKEASAALQMLALSLQGQEELGQTQQVDPIILQQIAAYLPTETEPTLSESDVQVIVAAIKQRVFVYHLTQSRLNQFTQELKALQGNPDQGRILRRLYFALPGGPENFPERVRQEIMKLGWQKAGEQ